MHCTFRRISALAWLILDTGGFRVEIGVAPRTPVEGVSVSTMRRTNDDKWCDRFKSSIMVIQVLAMYRLRSREVNETPKEGLYGVETVHRK